MDVRTVTTLTEDDGTGRLIDVVPVRSWSSGQVDAAGRQAAPVDVIEHTRGMPVRYVVGATALNFMGRLVDVLSVRPAAESDEKQVAASLGLLLILTRADNG